MRNLDNTDGGTGPSPVLGANQSAVQSPPAAARTDKERKFLNIKVGTEFYDLLMTTPSFQSNWKAVSPAFYFLQRIAALNSMNGGKGVEFFSGKISEIFQPYTRGGYARFINDLEHLGILLIHHSYRATTNKKGDCMTYLVSNRGLNLIHDGNLGYLRHLHGDKETKRLNQKSISARGVMKRIYQDPVLDYVYDGLKHLTVDHPDAENTFNKATWTSFQRTSVSTILRSIVTKDFNDLEIDEENGRIFHEEILLKSDARHLLRYQGMPYRGVVDVRCCHPTFFSSYIISISNPYPPSPTPIPSDPSLSLHYVTHNRDIEPLMEEHRRWVDLFCDPANDPREFLKKACNLDSPTKTAKSALNESLNGSKRFPSFLNWMQSSFPTLFGIWQGTDVKTTGQGISRGFERPLILNRDLFDYADSLGVKVMPEHDGLGVFSKDDEETLRGKLTSIGDRITSISNEQFGVPVVVKSKVVYNWADGDLEKEMTVKWGQFEKEFLKVAGDVDRARRRMHASNSDSGSSFEYQAAVEREKELLRRNKSVIEYRMGKEGSPAIAQN